LHVASAIKGSIHIIKYLGEQAINLDQLDSSGRSALFISLKAGNDEVALHLQHKGATAYASHEKWAKILCIIGL
jgi:ankyrin repeat protein